MMEVIISFVFLLMNLLTCILSYRIITKEKIMFNKKNIFLLLIFTIISVVIRYLNNILINLITNIYFIYKLIKIYFNTTGKKSIYFSIILSIILVFSDAFCSMIIKSKYLVNFTIYLEKTIFRAFLIVPMCLIAIIFCSLPFVKIMINIFYDKFINKIKLNKKTLLFLSLFIIIFFLLFCLNAYNEVDKFGHSIIILGLISFTMLFVAVLYFMYNEYQINLVNRKIIEENNYIKSIAKQDEEFKHNLVNNLLGIKTIANKKTSKLIEELINDYQQEYKNITNINDLPNGIQSIIYRKAYEENIEDLNLIVDNLIKKELYDLLNPKKYNHLCTSIGILFDNALEAVKNNNEKIIEINFSEDEDNIYVVLKNPFTNFIDLEEIGKRNVTSKLKGHGIGVNYISRLKTLKLKNEIINNMFVSKIIVKKSKKYI